MEKLKFGVASLYNINKLITNRILANIAVVKNQVPIGLSFIRRGDFCINHTVPRHVWDALELIYWL